MLLLLEEKDAEEWNYRGEGAANVVMSYHGASPDFVGKVLRVQKVAPMMPDDDSPRKNVPILTTEEQLLWADWQEVVEAKSDQLLGQAYAQHVIGPLLGSEHVDPGTLVFVTERFLEALNQNIYNQRPPWRIEASKINLDSGFALLMSDHSMFSEGHDGAPPCISVEIKPKCGFLPSSRFISAENSMKRLVSRFAMHQHLKRSEEKIGYISKYSPLDLFSESPDRIHQAIEGLFENPQNNLRIFSNGSLVLGGLGGYAEEVLPNGTTSKLDLEDVLENVISYQEGERVARLKDLITEALLETRMLCKLLALQKMDLYDIEGAIHAYYNIINEPCPICTCTSKEGQDIWTAENNSMPDDSMENPRDGNDSNFHSFSLENGSETHEHIQNNVDEYSNYLHSLTIEESRKIVRNFLLATTAKDCSLMLTFQPVHHDVIDIKSMDEKNIILLASTRQAFRYKARYVDLDLKRLGNMIHYYKMDKKIVNYYTRMHEADKFLNSERC